MKITIIEQTPHSLIEEIPLDQLIAMAPEHTELDQIVPGVGGMTFHLKPWYAVWRSKHNIEPNAEPTHMQVEASDEFQALIPWNELDQAVFLYEQNGKPLEKGYPLRLYVPDGTSQCLNVKSIVKISFVHDATQGNEADFGFKNTVALDDLKLKK